MDTTRAHHSLAEISAVVFALASGATPAVRAAEIPAQPSPPAARLQASVEVEEEVYRYEPADNGAGPMWCHGSTCLVRQGADVFASGLETLRNVKPLNNCRWMLFHRATSGWRKVRVDDQGRTREPSPLAGFADGQLFLSANPTLATNPAAYSGPARPEILRFSASNLEAAPQTLLPIWEGAPEFTEHSYRSFAADGPNRELILFQNIGYTHAEWAFRDRDTRWRSGKLKWPVGTDYGKPQPIRVCYPNVALKDRAVHFCGVSDIIEPNPEWRAFKKQLTGREWDYDFRRLFYTWTPDLSRDGFRDWVEIASRERTCGWVTPGDLWVAADGTVHLLWMERALDERLRQKFFPGEKQRHSLNHATVKDGRVMSRQTLLLAEEGGAQEIPGRGRFHVTPDGRLLVFFYVSGRDAAGKAVSENRLMERLPDGTWGQAERVPLRHPFSDFFTATVRAGSAPSWTLDLLGQRVDSPGAISYARVGIRPRDTEK